LVLLFSVAICNAQYGSGQGSYGTIGKSTSNGVTNAYQITPIAFQGSLYAYLTADTFIGTASGATITNWPDSSGNGHNLFCTGTTYLPEGIGGQAALAGTTSAWLTNAFFFLPSASLNTNVTIFIVARSFAGGGLYFCLMSSGTNSSKGVDYFPNYSAIDNGSYQRSGSSTSINPTAIAAGQTAIYAIAYSNPNGMDVWRNERAVWLSRINGTVTSGGLGIDSGMLSLGKDYTGFGGGAFNIACILVYSNCLSTEQIKIVNRYLAQKYGRQQREVLIEGDSQTQGKLGFGSNPNQLLYSGLANSLYGYDIECVANGGRSLDVMSNDAAYYLNTVKPPVRVYWLEDNAQNGNDGTLSFYTNNVMWLSSAARSNGWLIVMNTPICTAGNNAAFTNQVAWLKGAGTNYYDGLIDISGNTNYGAQFSYTNAAYYNGDQTHLSALAMTNFLQQYAIPTIRTVFSK
jgi:hypothetical protein